MRRLVLPGLITVVLFLQSETALANGMARMGQVLVSVTVIPLVLMAIALVCAIQVSKSRFALLYYPAIGGLIAAACVPPLIRANLSAELFLFYGTVYGLTGLLIGVLAFLISEGVARHRTKDKPVGDSREKS